MTIRRCTSLVLVVLLAVLAPACGGDDDDDAGEAGTSGATEPADGAQEDTATKVTAKDFEFDPASIDVAAGTVALAISNAGNAPHTFTIDELDVDHEVPPGGTDSATITAGEAGEFTYYCRFHRGRGMEGKLVVGG